jgi:hypothetical protein
MFPGYIAYHGETKMKYFILVFLFIVPNIILAKDEFYAFVPYINYDPTQAWSLGGAFEKKSTNKNNDTYLFDLEATPYANIHLQTQYKTHIYADWAMLFEASFSNFYDSFYGLGMKTKVQDNKRLEQKIFSSQIKFLYEDSDTTDFSFGPYIGFKQRIERPDYQAKKQRFFEDESSLFIGMGFLYDTRDSIFNPRTGDKHELLISMVPDGANNLKDKSTFSQVKIDLRKYFSIFNTVLATRFATATTIGSPSYIYQYRLGGFDYLRGYQTNRFIGDKLAVLQVEERVDLYQKYIIATASVEAGTVSNNLMDNIRISKSLGLRIAMPPDWTNLLSVNLGFGNDQNNFSMEFNENF